MSQRGLTLIELVIALALAGSAVAGAYGAVVTVTDHQRHAVAAGRDDLRAARIRQAIVSSLVGAELPVEQGTPMFRGRDGIWTADTPSAAEDDGHAVHDDDLVFLSGSAGALGEPAVSLIHLFVDHDEHTPERGLTVEWSPWPNGALKRRELERRVAGMRVRYFSRVMHEPVWMPSWISSTILPAGVMLTFESLPGDTLPSALALPVVVALESGR